jgi:hypothetical protein
MTFVGMYYSFKKLVNPYSYWTPASELDNYLKSVSNAKIFERFFTSRAEGLQAKENIEVALRGLTASTAPNQGMAEPSYPLWLSPSPRLMP